MVWIPGGGNFAGSASETAYDGESLARLGVVVVTVNYRLGPFGFFAHPALTRESPHHASGNQGLLDQIAALKWVRANIARFGGDPANVTVFGESAGSIDLSVLMTSPLSKGLFHRAIGESGTAMTTSIGPCDACLEQAYVSNDEAAPRSDRLTLREAERRGEALGQRWTKRDRPSLADLRAVPNTAILDAEPIRLLPPHGQQFELADAFPNLGIIVDGYVLTTRPEAAFARGQQHHVPMLLGNNAREGFVDESMKDLRTAILRIYGPDAERAQTLYLGSPVNPSYGAPVDQWATDTLFRCAAVAQLTWHAAAGNPSFEYEFTRVPSGREVVGATHASEITYVFGSLDRAGFWGIGPPGQPTQVDHQLSDVMQRYWTNFAKTGNPNGDQLPAWPQFTSASRAYVEFGDGSAAQKAGLRRPYCDLFIEHANHSVGR